MKEIYIRCEYFKSPTTLGVIHFVPGDKHCDGHNNSCYVHASKKKQPKKDFVLTSRIVPRLRTYTFYKHHVVMNF